MDIQEAIESLMASEDFRARAKVKDTVGSRYRMFVSRYRREILTMTTVLSFLLEHGYTMVIYPPDPQRPPQRVQPRRRQRKNGFEPVNKEKNGTVDWDQLQAFMQKSKR